MKKEKKIENVINFQRPCLGTGLHVKVFSGISKASQEKACVSSDHF